MPGRSRARSGRTSPSAASSVAIWSGGSPTSRTAGTGRTAERPGSSAVRWKDREIVFAVFPSVDELGHTFGIAGGRPREALVDIDGLLRRRSRVRGRDRAVCRSRPDGHRHAPRSPRNRRGVRGTTIAYPLITKRFPRAVVCESGNGMANVYLPGEGAGRSVRRSSAAASSLCGCSRSTASTASPFAATGTKWRSS